MGDHRKAKRRKLDPSEQSEAAPVDEKEMAENEIEELKRVLRANKIKVTRLGAAEGGEGAEDESQESKSKKSKRSDGVYPKPLLKFTQLHARFSVSRRLSENLSLQGYRIPTEVQSAALPLVLDPSTTRSESVLPSDVPDLSVVAQTGSGKTIAYLVPLIASVQRRRANQRAAESSLDGAGAQSATRSHRVLQSIILVPTRELLDQVYAEARLLSHNTGVKVIGLRKGQNLGDSIRVASESSAQVPAALHQRSEEPSNSSSESEEEVAQLYTSSEDGEKPLNRKLQSQTTIRPDILIATPGYLAGLREDSKAILSAVEHLVFDEADILLDALFREQTLAIWSACSSPNLQHSFWSATSPAGTELLIQERLAARPNVVHRPLLRLVVGLKDSALPSLQHRLIYTATEPGKLLAMRQLLHPSPHSLNPTDLPLRPPFLIFAQTIPRATALAAELLYEIAPEAGGSSRIACLHSAMSSAKRADTLARFRRGDIWVLIATDLLSRGIDFRGINVVINYDLPGSGGVYIHRVGRAGRVLKGSNGNAEKRRRAGTAVTFYTKEDIPVLRGVVNVIRACESVGGVKDSERATSGIQQWLLDALPKVKKGTRKRLKTRGVEERREGDSREQKRNRISTKSGYERKLEQRKHQSRGKKPRGRGLKGKVPKPAMGWEGFRD